MIAAWGAIKLALTGGSSVRSSFSLDGTMKPRAIFRSLIGTALVFLCGNLARAAVFNIPNGDVAALQSAITTANSDAQDDTIELAAFGTYTLTTRDNFINGLPKIGPDGGKKLTIHGNGAIIQRSNVAGTLKFRIFYIQSGANVTISNLTIANGNITALGGSFGGGIYSDGESGSVTLTIANCTFSGNLADYGGALYNDGESGISSITATLNVTNSTFTLNSSVNNGGALFNDGFSGSAKLSISNCTFTQNSSRDGGAVQHDAFMGIVTGSVINSTFTRNSASRNGGAIYIDGESGSATLNVSSSTFSENAATSSGNAVFTVCDIA